MPTPEHQPGEIIQYRRSAALPGIELLDAYHTSRDWQLISPSYGLCFLQTWRGTATYRGRTGQLKPGIGFCNYADEPVTASPERGAPGTFKSLIVAPDLMRSWVAERNERSLGAEWRSLFPAISPNLLSRLHVFSDALEPGTSDLELQSRAVEMADGIVAELIAGAPENPPDAGPTVRRVLRMRECLEDADFTVDLNTLARVAGLNRFQALRAFKKYFGLPPHAYQLRLRVTRARVLLLQGASASEVALQCGFADQSHLIRHFKRIAGVTPSQYVGRRPAATGVDRVARSTL
ncbi:MAG TPA: AraC family transcriptional regulator [Polyangiaceae bacterium]|nr:AraC family transcriptional regulator [Polyangiaceae bacterium]